MKIDRKDFIVGAASAAVLPRVGIASVASDKGLKLRFLGTGAADWNGRDERGELRRLTSALIEDSTLIDFTPTDKDMIPSGVSIDTIFYTHSHGDHFSPYGAIELGVKRAYVHESWISDARMMFAKVADKMGKAAPEVLPLAFFSPIEVGGIRFTALPANHSTSRKGERTAIYLVEKDGVRLLYATDTAGIPADSARYAGIDIHQKGEGITALVMEATMGVDHEDDFRLFTHSSVATVARTVRVLTDTKRYCPTTTDQKVYLTHMARTLHGTQSETEKAVPSPLFPAYDGLEVRFAAPDMV